MAGTICHERSKGSSVKILNRCLGSTRLCLLPLALLALSAAAQNNAPKGWIWAGGNSTLVPDNGNPGDVGRPGVYGRLGVPAPTNMPGARDSAATWTDLKGNFWMFGGNGYDAATGVGLLNDLWEFNTSTLQWTWMGGSSTLPDNQSLTGQPGIYGTLGIAAPGNVPGGRKSSVTWTDKAGKLWLFGGEGYGTINQLTGNTAFGDLWVFDPSTSQWAWMGGSNQIGITSWSQPGVYGTKGIPAAQNMPGSRDSAASWTDGSGNLWLFGGSASNDLWKFNPSTGLWAWMSGSPGNAAQPGIYGTMGVADAANVPGTREDAISWTDSSGNFWLFGGNGYDAGITDPNNVGYLNDLWEFTPATNEWTWVGGSNTLPCGDGCGEDGVYGTLGVPAPQNAPGGRQGGAHWTDSSGNLWLFAGLGFAASGPYGYLNDLWEFTPSTKEWTWQGGNIQISTSTPNCVGPQTYPGVYPGIYGTLGIAASANIPGSRDGVQSWVDQTGGLWLFGGYGADANGCLGDQDDLWTYQSSAGRSSLIAATPVVSPAAGTYTTSQSVTVTDATPGALIYYTTDGVTAPTGNSTQYNGPITVSATETIQAIALAPSYLNSSIASAIYTVNLPPPDFAVAVASPSLTVTAGQTATTTLSITPANGFDSPVSFTCSGLSSGASCSFSPATVTPSGKAANTTLSVVTSASTASSSRRTSHIFPGALAIGLCFFGWNKRRRFRLLSLLGVPVIMAGLQLLSGCGGGAAVSPPPQPVTSTITVTAASGSLQHTSTFTLTIN